MSNVTCELRAHVKHLLRTHLCYAVVVSKVVVVNVVEVVVLVVSVAADDVCLLCVPYR